MEEIEEINAGDQEHEPSTPAQAPLLVPSVTEAPVPVVGACAGLARMQPQFHIRLTPCCD